METGLGVNTNEQDLADTKIITAMNQCDVDAEGQDFEEMRIPLIHAVRIQNQ